MHPKAVVCSVEAPGWNFCSGGPVMLALLWPARRQHIPAGESGRTGNPGSRAAMQSGVAGLGDSEEWKAEVRGRKIGKEILRHTFHILLVHLVYESMVSRRAPHTMQKDSRLEQETFETVIRPSH